MNNIFENAKFGDKFRTRDGRKAVFYNHHNSHARERARFVTMILENQESIYRWYYDGTATDDQEHLDIVSEWQEEINEEELESKVDYFIDSLAYWEACEDEPELFAEDFKKLLDLAPKHPRVLEYCNYLIKSANAHFKEAMQAIIKKESISEEELDRLATIEGSKAISHFVNKEQSKFAYEWADLVKEAYKEGYRKAKES